MESETDLNEAFAKFKALADQKAEIFDEDIMSIISSAQQNVDEDFYQFISLSQKSETGEQPFAKIVLKHAGLEHISEAHGNGPVDATFNAIELQAKSGTDLLIYSVNAITTGTQSQGEVTVRLSKGGRVVNGVGTDPDIVAASAKAYLAALNRLYDPSQEKLNAQMSS
jgi:2-isopropylmalate synthase